MWYIETMEYYSAIKKNEIMSFAAPRMNLKIIILIELSDRGKKNIIMMPIYMWKPKEKNDCCCLVAKSCLTLGIP